MIPSLGWAGNSNHEVAVGNCGDGEVASLVVSTPARQLQTAVQSLGMHIRFNR